MKKKFLTILAVASCVLLLMLTAGAETYGKFVYQNNGNGVTITDYNGTSIYSSTVASEYVSIPSYINGYPVTVIGNSAFSYNQIYGIDIPATVKKIDAYAFYNCRDLVSAYIPSSVTELGSYVFSGCSKLKTVKFDAGCKLTSVGNNVVPLTDTLYCITNVHVLLNYNRKYFEYTSGKDAFMFVYSLDNRQCYIRKTDLAAHKSVGWYETPVVKMYALDGRTSIVPASETQKNRQVGWYDTLAEVQTKVYAADGRSKIIYKARIDAEKAVGWYPAVTMYAADGRSVVISPFSVNQYKAVGWFDKKSDVYTKLYTADGRVIEVLNTKVQDFVNVGWSKTPFEFVPTDSGDDWKYRNGVLYLYTEGKVSSYYNSNSYPKYRDNIANLYITDSVTSLENSAFSNYKTLSRVEIPDTVSSVGYSVFYNDKNLSRLGIPSSVKNINSRFLDKDTHSNCVIYCEQGTAAEAYALDNGFKYEYATPVYALDGRVMMVTEKEKPIYLESGLWFAKPSRLMYALDGRTIVVAKSQVENYKRVGWYATKEEVLEPMFALDGRTKVVYKANVANEKAVGWYVFNDYVNALLNKHGYNLTCDRIEDAFLAHGKVEYLLKRDEVVAAWYKKTGTPLVITGWEKSTTDDGVACFNIPLRNLSTKTIKYFKFEFTCLDNNGNVVALSSYHNGIVTVTSGIFSSKILPGFKFSGQVEDSRYSKVSKISWPRVTEVTFEDGTVWKP